MNLETYLKDNKISHESFGQRIGRTRAQVWKYCQGDHTPRPEILKKIVKVTKGHVQPASFYE